MVNDTEHGTWRCEENELEVGEKEVGGGAQRKASETPGYGEESTSLEECRPRMRSSESP